VQTSNGPFCQSITKNELYIHDHVILFLVIGGKTDRLKSAYPLNLREMTSFTDRRVMVRSVAAAGASRVVTGGEIDDRRRICLRLGIGDDGLVGDLLVREAGELEALDRLPHVFLVVRQQVGGVGVDERVVRVAAPHILLLLLAGRGGHIALLRRTANPD
jgi:hypothetical protein